MPLTDKKRKFTEQYALTKNATQAAIRAGYGAKSAHVTGCRLLKDPNVSSYLAEITAVAETRAAKETDGAIASLAEVLGYQTKVMRLTRPDDEDDKRVRNALKAADGLQRHYEGDKDKGSGVTITVNALIQMLGKRDPGEIGTAAKMLLKGAE